jgi:GAF domain-containing protein
VPDVAKQSLFGLVTVSPTVRIRGFVTVPLLTSGERLVGALGLLAFKPLTLTAAQLDLLLDAARKIADELERELNPNSRRNQPSTRCKPISGGRSSHASRSRIG